MSKTISIVTNGSAITANLVSFATSLVGKATKNAVGAKAVANATSNAVVIGAEVVPTGVVAAVTNVKGAGAYAGVNATLVRSILPRKEGEALPLNIALDVLNGADLSKETAAAEAAIKQSAKLVVDAAKAKNLKKIVLMVKQQSAFDNINTIFTEVSKSVIEGAGITVEVLPTSAVTNNLIMFPEDTPLVFTNDVPQCELVEKVFAGVVGSGAPTEMITVEGKKVYAGSSTTSVAAAIASALAEIGFAAEASAVAKAAVAGKTEAEILAAL